MAKKTEKTEKKPETKAKEAVPEVQETPPEAAKVSLPATIVAPGPVPETTPEENDPPPEVQKRYVFPRQGDIKCPGCGLYETVAVSTRGAIQVRKCTRSIPVCRYTSETFKVTGTEVKIKSTDCKQDT